MMEMDIEDLLLVSRHNVNGVLGGVGFEQVWHVWLFVGSFLLLGWLGWRFFHAEDRARNRDGGFLAFLFPRRIYRHESSRADITLLVINQITSPLSIAFALTLGGSLASGTSHALTLAFGWDARFDWNPLAVLAFTLSIALVSDLATYIVHRLHHTVPALWEIHKVHHSAEVLSPLTVFRKHPVFDLINRTLKALLTGPLQGVVFFLFAGPVDAMTAIGANLVFGVFHLAGASLRHSHVWLSYGPVAEHLLISPAQHQIHHSRARRHWDRNFGQVFAVWDWMFGTLYVPERREELEFGVDDAPARAFSGLNGGCVRPVLAAARMYRLRRHT